MRLPLAQRPYSSGFQGCAHFLVASTREVIGEESTIPDDHPECHLSFRCFAHRPSFREKNWQVRIPSSLWISNLEDFLERYYERESTDRGPTARIRRSTRAVNACIRTIFPSRARCQGDLNVPGRPKRDDSSLWRQEQLEQAFTVH